MGHNNEDPRPSSVPYYPSGSTILPAQGLLVFKFIPSGSLDMRRFQPDARENRSIINVSSTSGLHGNVGQANYAAAKAAVIGLTKTIAKEWGPYGVRANTIAFGLIHTRYAFVLHA